MSADNALYLRQWAADIRKNSGSSVDADRLDAIAAEIEHSRLEAAERLQEWLRAVKADIDRLPPWIPARLSDGEGCTEAHVVINGTALAFGQSMALRVAVSNFLMELADPEAVEALGVPLANGYRDRLSEILKLMIGNAAK